MAGCATCEYASWGYREDGERYFVGCMAHTCMEEDDEDENKRRENGSGIE